MPLFRFHRGGLKESLQTTIIVKNLHDLMLAIFKNYTEKEFPESDWGFNLKISPYPDIDTCFDIRIGWFTYIVTANLYEKDGFHPIGFLSEPLDESIDENI